LDCYKDFSGNKINNQKNHVFGWNCSPREMFDISITLEMDGHLARDSFNYLGVPIFKVVANSAHWLPLLDKLKIRIHNWGASWLNLVGKLVLLNSVLASIPIYQNSLLLAPKSITLKLDAMLRHFQWEGGKLNDKKIHLVSWNKINKLLLEGGLQIRDVSSQNLAMGGKLLWNLVSGKPSWRKEVLWKKYFQGAHTNFLDKPPKTI